MIASANTKCLVINLINHISVTFSVEENTPPLKGKKICLANIFTPSSTDSKAEMA